MERNDKIEVGQECAKSDSPEGRAHGGDTIIPALLKIIPSDSIIEWDDRVDGFRHSNMVEHITEDMIDRMPKNPIIKYITYLHILVIGEDEL